MTFAWYVGMPARAAELPEIVDHSVARGHRQDGRHIDAGARDRGQREVVDRGRPSAADDHVGDDRELRPARVQGFRQLGVRGRPLGDHAVGLFTQHAALAVPFDADVLQARL
ncbi:hypothetical protein [Streptomyces sp. NPDC059874]|uniref:hypothetical protein n=1 Tax=Streptomyces sp. NPDC059874 TaxID=3346983 RepID=UPI00364E68DF